MNRRGFLGSIIAMAAAPAIVRASSLMPGRVWTPTLKTGWMAWNAGFLSHHGLWSPGKSIEFIAEHNSFDDKPYRISTEQAERDYIEATKDSILLTPSAMRNNDWADINVIKDRYVPIDMRSISGEHWSHEGFVRRKK
jgi:hypothetical protein